ncbi:MAG TPA: hypothetical protein VL334_16365 [Anaerolineae bacterium]|nr:hypothetical protein [Anaerolineae bacterium]
MPQLLRSVRFFAGSALLLLALAACAAGAPTVPQQVGTPAPDQGASVLDIFATDTPTATPTSTLTPTPTSTPTPLPTPTPVAALSVGSLPAGQVLFSTQRAGEEGEQLWRVSVEDGLVELRSDLLPGGWRCTAGGCAFVTLDRGLFALQPMSGTTTLLDDLTPVLLAASPAVITPTLGLTGTVAMSPTQGMTWTMAVSPTLVITAVVELTATLAVSPAQAISATAALPVLAFSPDGERLAVATQDRVTVYDLAEPALLATLQAGSLAELAWSPDGQQLALAYPAGEGNALALWSLADGQLRVLAQMEAAGRLAWAPDGSKLAFDARTSPGTPTSQGSQPDIYVLYLRSGEIANLTEVFVRNVRLDPSQWIGGWAPQWEADSETLRYVRGIPGRIEEQNIVRHPLRSRSPTVLWPVADEGKLGMVADPNGQGLARVTLRDGRDMVQVSLVPNAWQDAMPGTFADVAALAWAPVGEADVDTSRLLLLADRQTLWLLDPTSGNLSGLAVACPDCLVTQAVWLPLPQD